MLYYLAGPYTHEDAYIRQQRAVEHTIAAGKIALLDRGAVFSPIAHGHRLAEVGGVVTLDHGFWMRQCLPFLYASDALIVLTLDGWRESRGTQREMQEAEDCGIPVYRWAGNNVDALMEMIEG